MSFSTEKNKERRNVANLFSKENIKKKEQKEHCK